jgi:two-component system LytT family sensor kinase
MSNFVQLEINNKNRWVYITKYRWVAHAIYWLWVLIFGTLLRAEGPITFSLVINHFVLDNLIIACFYYVYCLFLIPYYFKRNKNTLFWLLIVLCYFSFTALDVVYHNVVVDLSFQSADQPGPNDGFLDHYLKNLTGYLFNFLIFSIMLFFMEKSEENHTFLELEKEKKEIEQVKLDLLKTNISPDFIMRSLSQLKQAALREDHNTPESILTFSDLLRYRLYRGRQQNTPLTEELEALYSFIHFIDLNKDSNRLKVQLITQGAPEHKLIAPLSLVNLLEPFCNTQTTEPTELQMVMLIEEEELVLEMDYNIAAPDSLLKDLEEYGLNYKQLYDDKIQFHFENCEDARCIIKLSLPISW